MMKKIKLFDKRFRLLYCMGLIAIMSLPVNAQQNTGEQLFQRCQACHLADGQGIPGVFPRLKDRLAEFAGSPAGREYLVLVISKGLMGAITVDGQIYNGIMPVQTDGLDERQITDLLNYALEKMTSPQQRKTINLYTVNEVSSILSSNQNISAAQVGAKRKALSP